MCIMPRLDQPDDIQLTRADPLCDADVLIVDGSRVEHADSDGVEVAMSTDGRQRRHSTCRRNVVPRDQLTSAEQHRYVLVGTADSDFVLITWSPSATSAPATMTAKLLDTPDYAWRWPQLGC